MTDYLDFEVIVELIRTFDYEKAAAIEDSYNRAGSNLDRHVEVGKLICEGLEEKLSHQTARAGG